MEQNERERESRWMYVCMDGKPQRGTPPPSLPPQRETGCGWMMDEWTDGKPQFGPPPPNNKSNRDFGGRLAFSGQATTVRCFEANPLVRACLEEPGHGKVLVVDGQGSKRCALLGDNIAAMAVANGWAGIIINGCIRDSADIGRMDLGVKALATHPLKSAKRDKGLRDVPVSFAGVRVSPGDWVYADGDGVLVSPTELKL